MKPGLLVSMALLSLFLAGACNKPSAPLKTAAEMQQAQAYAAALVPLVFPKLATADAMMQEMVRTKITPDVDKIAKDNHIDDCIVKAGLPHYIAAGMGQYYTSSRISPQLTDIWVKKYSVVQLQKAYEYTGSEPMRKLNQARLMPGNEKAGTMDLMRSLHTQGVLNDADLKYMLGTLMDPQVSQFLTATDKDLRAVLERSKEESKEALPKMIKKFMEDNALAIVHCGKNPVQGVAS